MIQENMFNVCMHYAAIKVFCTLFTSPDLSKYVRVQLRKFDGFLWFSFRNRLLIVQSTVLEKQEINSHQVVTKWNMPTFSIYILKRAINWSMVNPSRLNSSSFWSAPFLHNWANPTSGCEEIVWTECFSSVWIFFQCLALVTARAAFHFLYGSWTSTCSKILKMKKSSLFQTKLRS